MNCLGIMLNLKQKTKTGLGSNSLFHLPIKAILLEWLEWKQRVWHLFIQFLLLSPPDSCLTLWAEEEKAVFSHTLFNEGLRLTVFSVGVCLIEGP